MLSSLFSPSPDSAPPAVLHLPANTEGSDYVVGDIHGEFAQLQHQLENIDFDPACDRLLSVGDLIDRGSDSAALLDWLAQPWFYAIRGNHEEMLLEWSIDRLDLWVLNGGSWWLEQDDSSRQAIREAVSALPWAMQVTTATGAVGLVHADIPAGWSWPKFCTALNKGQRKARQHALWSRLRAQGRVSGPVQGIDHVFLGHTPFQQPQQADQLFFIDTGACMNGHLTLQALLTPQGDSLNPDTCLYRNRRS